VNGFVDVEDVALSIRLALESDLTEQRYLICAENWRFKDLQQTMADGFGVKGPSRKATPFLLGLAWRLAAIKGWITSKHELLSKESARVGVSQTQFDNYKFLSAFPQFSYKPLRETILNACTRYRQ